jgi:hypothetical protein
MASHRIVCVKTEHPHRHVTKVGTGITAERHTRTWTIKEVREALQDGEEFYTVGHGTGVEAYVEADTCNIGGCTIMTIRTEAEAAAENNLENLAHCG